jgi:two-component system chemotaxis response regulator CheB
MKQIRVLIVEDSRVVREFLEHIIQQDPRLQVVGSVESGEEALRILDRAAPDVISMDVRLPGMDGFETTLRIMSHRPTPIVVVSASVEREDLRITMKALEAGALTVLEKPRGTTSSQYQAIATRLCTQLAIMSQVKVVRRRTSLSSPSIERPGRFESRAIPYLLGSYQMLGIVSSTGGPQALSQILNHLGVDFPLPIVLVQHITGSFLEGFASWLASICPFGVEIVKGGIVPARGKIYMAAQDRHLRIHRGTLEVDAGDPVCAQRPSGTVLFESMASVLGASAIGVLLTGMGEDGAQGLLHLRRSGAYTIAEHESTAVVYGMPKEAVRRGAVCESLPLPDIAHRLLELTQSKREVA